MIDELRQIADSAREMQKRRIALSTVTADAHKQLSESKRFFFFANNLSS
jgi:hypothetical protein